MVKNEGDRLKQVVTCTPKKEYFQVEDLKAQNINEIADPADTRKQHDQLKSIMNKYGSEVIDVEELTSHPNSVFTRDTSLVTPRGYVKLRMGLEKRRGEGEWMSKILDSMKVPWAGEIKEPGTVEGGDVILAGTVAFIGISERTNKEGADQLSGLLKEMGYELRTINLKGHCLHLGGEMSVIGPKKVLCTQGVFPHEFFNGFDKIEVPPYGPSSGNVICLGENEVIASKEESQITIDELKKHHIKVHEVDLSEFRKGAGGPSCLILPVVRE